MSLVLRRRWGEKVYLETTDGTVTVEVARIAGTWVELAITAPQSVNVYRDDAHWRQEGLSEAATPSQSAKPTGTTS